MTDRKKRSEALSTPVSPPEARVGAARYERLVSEGDRWVLRGSEEGPPAEPRLGDVERMDVDMAAQISEGPVIEIGLVRVEEGVPHVVRGKITAVFQQRIRETCGRNGIRKGWIGGVRRGKRGYGAVTDGRGGAGIGSGSPGDHRRTAQRP